MPILSLILMTTIASQPYLCSDGRELQVGRWWTEPVETPSGEYVLCGGNLPVEGKVGAGTNTCVTVNVDRCEVTPFRTTMQTVRQALQPLRLSNSQYLLLGGNTSEASRRTQSVDRLSPTNGRVRSTSLRLPEPRLAFAAARVGESILVTGGFGVKDPATQKEPILNTAVLLTLPGKPQLIPMTARRGGHSLTKLPDGRLLVIGGIGDDPNGAEIFDPKTKQFSAITSKMKYGRKDHRAVLANDGKVYILGGTQGKDAPTAIEVFDPTTNTFSETGLELSQGREDLAVVFISELNLIVAAGGEVKGAAGEPESQAIDVIDLDHHRVTSAKLTTPRDEATVVVRKVDTTARTVQLLVLSGQRKVNGGELPLPAEEITVTLE